MCVIDVFTKHAFVKPLTDKKVKTVLDGFIKIINECKQKQNKLWVHQGKEFHHNLMQKCLDNNNILMYSIYNEGKSVVAERFIRTLKGKICNK